MPELNLYVAQFVSVVEEQWWSAGCPLPNSEPDPETRLVRSEKDYAIKSTLFSAASAEDAYSWACKAIEWDNDRNHDGPGDLTKFYYLGIHQIERLNWSLSELVKQTQYYPYGLGLGRYSPADVDEAGVPLIRSKDQLEIFTEGG